MFYSFNKSHAHKIKLQQKGKIVTEKNVQRSLE